jgi:hypothetical protein
VTALDVLRLVVQLLDRAAIPHMLTGSFAGSFHGAPRATQDIDIVIAPTAGQLRALSDLVPRSEYYMSAEAALEALQRESQFNIIDLTTGWKVDLIIRKSRPFSRLEFERRERIDVQGQVGFVVSAEDLVIAKLEWAKLGNSARQIEDVASILRIRGDDLDSAYLERWISELDLQREWDIAFGLSQPGAGDPEEETPPE